MAAFWRMVGTDISEKSMGEAFGDEYICGWRARM
jgi:hypothetical protein